MGGGCHARVNPLLQNWGCRHLLSLGKWKARWFASFLFQEKSTEAQRCPTSRCSGRAGVTALADMSCFARLSCLLNLFGSRLIRALLPGDPGKRRVGAGKAAFVKHTQARWPRHQIHKIQDVFMSFYCGLYASHILVHCTNGRIVLISYKNQKKIWH